MGMFEGAFNHCFRSCFNLSHGVDWLLRSLVTGNVTYPAEKIDLEVSVMESIREKIGIIIPRVIVSGRAAGGFAVLGHSIISDSSIESV